MEIKNDEEIVECATKTIKEIMRKYRYALPELTEKGVDYGGTKFSRKEADQIMESISSKLWIICKLGLGKELVEASNKIVDKETNLGRRLKEDEIQEIIDEVIAR